jgi:hypothetical protein
MLGQETKCENEKHRIRANNERHKKQYTIPLFVVSRFLGFPRIPRVCAEMAYQVATVNGRRSSARDQRASFDQKEQAHPEKVGKFSKRDILAP